MLEHRTIEAFRPEADIVRVAKPRDVLGAPISNSSVHRAPKLSVQTGPTCHCKKLARVLSVWHVDQLFLWTHVAVSVLGGFASIRSLDRV